MSCELDHLVVVAHTLEQGVQWCEATLGVVPAPGGRHPLMGTHNRLLRIAAAPDFPRAYLEIIAIDPEAASPGRPRWFGMDDADLQRSVAQSPQLVHWVAGTAMLDMLRWGLVAAGLNPGEPLAASRDTPAGRLQWRIGVRDDGALLCGGAVPTLIEWQGAHPVDTLPDAGVRLESVCVRGLPAQAAHVLRPRGVQRATDAGPLIEAVLTTPRGRVRLCTGGQLP